MSEQDCAALKIEIESLQREGDRLWLAISGGQTAATATWRATRERLDALRTKYQAECGKLTETSELPPSVLSGDWRA